MLFVTNALSPAKVQRVSIVDDHERVMEVVVEDKQLSLAIGKKGQNVRLAAKLTGWRIDIKSEEEKRREVELQFAGLEMGGESDEATTAEGDVAADAAGAGTPDAQDESAGEVSGGEQEPVGAAAAVDAADAAEPRPPLPNPNTRATRSSVRRDVEVTVGNCPDLQSRGAAGNDQPGSDGAAQARSRHRGEERLEHD